MMKLSVLSLICLCALPAVNAIYGVTGDGAGAVTASPQSGNLPAVFGYAPFDNTGGHITGSTSSKYVRKTDSTYVKFYVNCVGLTSASHTYTLSYSLDGETTKVVGSSYTEATSKPYIMIEDLEEGSHSLTVTCTQNALNGNPAVEETTPLVFKWIVDKDGAPDVSFKSTPDEYTNDNTVKFVAKSSRPNDEYGTLSWEYYFDGAWTASTENAGLQTATFSVPVSSKSDGKYDFKARVTLTDNTPTSTVTNPFYYSDIGGTSGTLTGSDTTSFTRDTTPPVIAVTSSPAKKSTYTAGMKAKFEFACKAGEVSCSYKCSFDGMDSPDYDDEDASKGYFDCSSPLKLTVKNTTTHSFRVYAKDAAGNDSPKSNVYMFYADGTPPTVSYTRVDANAGAFGTNQLAAGATYYALDDTVDTSGVALKTAAGAAVTANVISDISYLTTAGTEANTGTIMNSSSYNTVLQFPFSPTTPVYQLSNTYGAILAMKSVNGKYYYNVLDATNADFGRLNYMCTHSEMA